MSVEVECKVLISKEEFEKIIKKFNLSISKTLKKDTYYRSENMDSNARIRIREEEQFKNKKYRLTVKNKNVEDGFENNQEYESVITNIDILQKLFEVAKLEKCFEKTKLCYGFTYESGFFVEVEKVWIDENNPIYAIEIERVTDKELQPFTKETEIDILKNFLDKKEIEVCDKDWTTLLRKDS